MDEQYRAKLTATPPLPGRPPRPHTAYYAGERTNGPSEHFDGAHDPSRGIHIQPHPNIGTPHQGPIPIHLPNIFVNPFPQQPNQPPPEPMINVPTSTMRPKDSNSSKIKLGPWRMARPHPLLWVCFALSILALVLEVPKGALPTLTGRHKALRNKEKLLQDRVNLLSQLSVFLPPPLGQYISPNPILSPSGSALLTDDQLRLVPALKFWNTHSGLVHGVTGQTEGGRWWSVEELGHGASVVKSKSDKDEREVWVLRVGDGETEDKALWYALNHALLLRHQLLDEITRLKDTPCPDCPVSTALVELPPQTLSPYITRGEHDDAYKREERERREEIKRREREREREVEEREIEVARREKWVIEEMRKLSDKVHAQATELTLEDRITERLKSYQRQLAQVHEHDEL